jgi:DNA-binding transcriptional LysR family regulator
VRRHARRILSPASLQTFFLQGWSKGANLMRSKEIPAEAGEHGMRRPLNLRQIEAFKAVVENGTVSRAADILHVSQPAVSKLLLHLEHDTGLQLFERVKGRLIPTKRGIRLYEEIDRIFAGVSQIESAVDFIQREDQGRLVVGVMPALAGSFIQRATIGFMRQCPDVYVSIHARSSQFIADWLVTRQLDIGLISPRIGSPFFDAEPVMEHPLVCIMPPNHRLAEKSVIRPDDLDGEAFISFAAESYTSQRIAEIFDAYNVRAKFVLDATVAPTVCEFVAAGCGVSLVHPLFADGVADRIVMRPFEPVVPFYFLICRARETRNVGHVKIFSEAMRAAAAQIFGEILKTS